MHSLKKNIVLNGINTLTSIIFPIITFPYAARVLLPEGIGSINFLNSIIGYIILFTSLGIPLYGVKEIAKYKDDKEKRDKITLEIIILSIILCGLGYVIVWVLAHFIPEIHAQMSLFYVLSISILFSAIGVNWFYQAIEDFKFITIRAIIIRTLAAAALFIFVHNPSDLLIYGYIVVGSTVGNNLLNFIHLRKHVSLDFHVFKDLRIAQHIKPTFQIFILNVIISLYISLNSIMLGFISDENSVGYFIAGTRISYIGVTLISSIGTVLLPRCSHLIKEGKFEEFKITILKSLKLTQLLSYPMTIGLMVLVYPITIIFCGNDYYNAIPVAFVNAPVIIFISFTNIMGIQILYPMDKIKLVIYSVSGGALINLLLNFCLIPHYQALGTAIATTVAEFAVLILQIILGRNYYPFSLKNLLNINYICGSLLMGMCVFLTTFWMNHLWLMLLVGIPVGILVFALFLEFNRDDLYLEAKSLIKLKLRGRNEI